MYGVFNSHLRNLLETPLAIKDGNEEIDRILQNLDIKIELFTKRNTTGHLKHPWWREKLWGGYTTKGPKKNATYWSSVTRLHYMGRSLKCCQAWTLFLYQKQLTRAETTVKISLGSIMAKTWNRMILNRISWGSKLTIFWGITMVLGVGGTTVSEHICFK